MTLKTEKYRKGEKEDTKKWKQGESDFQDKIFQKAFLNKRVLAWKRPSEILYEYLIPLSTGLVLYNVLIFILGDSHIYHCVCGLPYAISPTIT